MLKFKIKTVFNLIFLLCLISIISAYFIEYILGHQPCNLCLIERIPYALGLILIILNYTLIKKDQFIILLLILIFAFSLIISLYHFGIEQGFFEESAICGLKNGTYPSYKESSLRDPQSRVYMMLPFFNITIKDSNPFANFEGQTENKLGELWEVDGEVQYRKEVK